MDPLITSMVNLGGMGGLAAAMFYLHMYSLKAFREELKAEREQCHNDHLRLEQALERITEVLLRRNVP